MKKVSSDDDVNDVMSLELSPTATITLDFDKIMKQIKCKQISHFAQLTDTAAAAPMIADQQHKNTDHLNHFKIKQQFQKIAKISFSDILDKLSIHQKNQLIPCQDKKS